MTLWPRFFSQVASLPQVVVLPLPCRPDIMMTVGPGLTCMIGSAGTGAPVSGSIFGGLAQQLDQLVVDDLDHLLAGLDGLEHRGPGGLLGHLFAEGLGHFVVHVGFEQGLADLLHRLADVGFGNGGLARELPQGAFELVGEVVEHGITQRSQNATPH